MMKMTLFHNENSPFYTLKIDSALSWDAIDAIRDYSISDIYLYPEQKTINKFRKKRIINAINNLKPKFKEIIIMYEINGLSYDEISKKLDIPIGTVKSRLYNAKQILAEELSDLI